MSTYITNDKPYRVLHIVSAMNRGGAETLLMNIYRNINREKIQFDFVSHREDDGHYDDEILKLGGRVYKIKSLGKSNPLTYIKNIQKILEENSYIAVHAHTDYQAGFPLLAAKFKGINKRIAHAHSTGWSMNKNTMNSIIFKLLKYLINRTATELCTCSSQAGQFLFNKTDKIKVLKNGIDLEQFSTIDDEQKLAIRDELGIDEDAFIIGHVGTFSFSKNQTFFLKAFKTFLNTHSNSFGIFIGEGPDMGRIIEQAKVMGIEEKLRFLGSRNDVATLMNVFDIFLFPSIFEGFGIVLLEAQSLGIPCVVSDQVPSSTNMNLDLMKYISLDESIQHWSAALTDSLQKKRIDKKNIDGKIKEQGYDIKENISQWVSIYGL